MFYARNEKGLRVRPIFSGQRAICGSCGEPVIGKCGEIVPWHWSHLSGSDCDAWAEPITVWHEGWQNILEYEEGANIEVPIEKDGCVHRADAVLKNGTIIELQHSTISPAAIREREYYYGERMIWLFDCRDAYDNDRFELRKKLSDVKRTFRWKHPKKSIAYANRKVYLDFGNDTLFFLIKLYPDTPCGGIGELVSRHDLTYGL